MLETTDVGDEATEAVGGECDELKGATKKRTQKQVDGTEGNGKQYEEKPHIHAMERAMAEWTKQKKTKKRTVVKAASRQGQQLEPRPGKKRCWWYCNGRKIGGSELGGGGTGREEAQVERKLCQWVGEDKTVHAKKPNKVVQQQKQLSEQMLQSQAIEQFWSVRVHKKIVAQRT